MNKGETEIILSTYSMIFVKDSYMPTVHEAERCCVLKAIRIWGRDWAHSTSKINLMPGKFFFIILMIKSHERSINHLQRLKGAQV